MSNKIERKVIKLAIFGDAPGKTSICNTFIYNQYNERTITTIGLEKFEKKIKMKDGKEIQLILFDTDSSYRFRSRSLSICNKVQGAFVCFNLTRRQTLEGINLWLEEIKNLNKNIEIVLLGNKCDMNDEREITIEEAEKFAEKCSLPYFETSAKKNININEAVFFLASLLYEKKIFAKKNIYANKLSKFHKTFSSFKLSKFQNY